MKPTKTASSPAKKPAVKPIPDGFHTVTSYLILDGAADAIKFYQKAFGATELTRVPTPEGKVMNAAIRIGDSIIMLNDEFPEMGVLGPKARQGTSVMLHLYVEDVDKAFARAVKAGAVVKMPLQDMFWGDRYGQLEDPFGHSWSMATHIRDMNNKEIQKAAKDACG